MDALRNKHILLGVTGGIAVYKSADLVRRLRDAGAEVRVVMTAAAQALVTPLTFQALSGHEVLTHWEQPESEFAMDHIALARWADLVLIAPTTADFMAKLAHGFASDVLSTLCLASTVPLILVPAMNQQMWANSATQFNKNQLQARGVQLLGPASGAQACGEIGIGRMIEPTEITKALADFFKSSVALQGVRVLVTAGPTQESLDPVRYISNHSSGKMGYALAQAAKKAGAEVILVSGPTQLSCPVGVKSIAVVTAEQMYNAVMKEAENCSIFIATAAVADYQGVDIAAQKIKKHDAHLTLSLQRTPDILLSVTHLNNPPFSVGFAAETEHLMDNAREKLQLKNLDMIVANEVGKSTSGFNAEQNAVMVLWDQGKQCMEFSLRDKTQLAEDLLQLIIQLYPKMHSQS